MRTGPCVCFDFKLPGNKWHNHCTMCVRIAAYMICPCAVCDTKGHTQCWRATSSSSGTSCTVKSVVANVSLVARNGGMCQCLSNGTRDSKYAYFRSACRHLCGCEGVSITSPLHSRPPCTLHVREHWAPMQLEHRPCPCKLAAPRPASLPAPM